MVMLDQWVQNTTSTNPGITWEIVGIICNQVSQLASEYGIDNNNNKAQAKFLLSFWNAFTSWAYQNYIGLTQISFVLATAQITQITQMRYPYGGGY